MAVTAGFDAIHVNIGHLPRGAQAAGYTTGSADIRWVAADWAAHPGAVRICQDSGSDHTADVIDVESGAATNADAAAWVPRAQAAFQAGARTGQRTPAVYTSASNVTPLVNTLIAHGIKGGVNLWVANWNLNESQAVTDVQNAAGPFPIVGVQYASGQFYDSNVFSKSWLENVSAKGLFEHHADGKQTIAQLAAARGMTPAGWVALQRKLHATDADKLVGDLVPGAGRTWWSIHP
jgi:hypothetical protein